jgi:transposase, IS5 family
MEGRRMRVDTTVVETNIHYPTDSSLLGDGVRMLIRTMKKITTIAGEAGARLSDRSRTVKLRVLDIARAARSKAKQSREKLTRAYGKLLNSTSRVVGQAKRFSKQIAAGVKRASSIRKQLVLEGLGQELDAMVPLIKQVMKQTERASSAAMRARKARSSVCSSRRQKSSARARRASPTSSVRW